MEPVLSDTASQHTFGGHGLNSSSASLSSFDISSHSHTGFSSDEENSGYRYESFRAQDMPEPSPVTFVSQVTDVDSEDDLGPVPPPRNIYYGRRRSLPMAIPGANATADLCPNDNVLEGREREPSLATLRRPSRSLDDEMRSMNINNAGVGVGGASEPLSKGDWATLELRTEDGQAPYQDINLGYILGGHDVALSRRSSDALSFAQPIRRPSQATQMLAFGWGWNGPVRRPSTATVATGFDDTFVRHLRGWDENYVEQKGFWFKKEKADGTSAVLPGVPLSATGTNAGQASPRPSLGERVKAKEIFDKAKIKEKDKKEERREDVKGMLPGSQEIWLCEFVGRFKVDRNTYRRQFVHCVAERWLIIYCSFSRPGETATSTPECTTYSRSIFVGQYTWRTQYHHP